MKDFVDGFYPTLETAAKEMKRGGEDTGITCDKCESPMVIKFGRTGEFLGCSNYPECKNIVNFTRDEKGKIVVLEEEPPEGNRCFLRKNAAVPWLSSGPIAVNSSAVPDIPIAATSRILSATMKARQGR